MKRNKLLALLCSGVLVASMMTGCSNNSTAPDSEKSDAAFDTAKQVTVVSREASSGTRSAFDELMKIMVKEDGKETNMLFPEAIIVNSTDEVSSKVEVDPFAIGYTSLGSVNDQIKAVKIDGVIPSEATVKDGSYKVARDLLIATAGTPSAASGDFIQFISSKQGQELAASAGFIKVDDAASEYTASGVTGKVTISGSTSCEKAIEKMKEAYQELNPEVTIEINYSGSGAGIKDALAGKVDIAMSSRNLTDEESAMLTPVVFAHDGIAIIVNQENPIEALTSEQVTDIFKGTTRTWAEVK